MYRGVTEVQQNKHSQMKKGQNYVRKYGSFTKTQCTKILNGDSCCRVWQTTQNVASWISFAGFPKHFVNTACSVGDDIFCIGLCSHWHMVKCTSTHHPTRIVMALLMSCHAGQSFYQLSILPHILSLLNLISAQMVWA